MKKIFLLTLIFFAGCYTIIRHPEVNYTGSAGETYTSYINYRSNCTSCHSFSELAYYYELMPAHTPSPWVYYNTPWWFWWTDNLPTDTSGQILTPVATPERARDFGSHRQSGNETFSPPPPTRTPPKSNADSNSSSSSSSSSIGKSDSSKSDANRNIPGVRSSNESSREQNKETEEARRKIGSKRK